VGKTSPPSSVGLYASCPASYTEIPKAKAQKLDINVYADEAEEGTDLHVLARPGVPLEGVPAETAALGLKARAYGEHYAAGAEWVAYEQHVTVWDADGKPLTYGTTDWMALFPGLVRLIDYKFLWGDFVEPLIDWQMRCYGEGSMQRQRIARAEAFVFNPRTGEERRGAYSLEEDIPAQIAEVIRAAEENPTDYRPGPWCRYCPAKAICPAFTEEALALSKRMPLAAVNVEELNRMLDICTAVEALGPALRKRLVEMVRAGEFVIPGREVRATKTREITDLPGLLGVLAEAGCTQEDWLPALKASLPALEKLYVEALGRRENGWPKKAAAEHFALEAAPFVETGERYELRKAKA